MPVPRGLVSPALIASTVVLILCCAAWGAFGALSAVPAGAAMPPTLHRYMSIALATLTILTGMVHLTARIIRAIREAAAGAAPVCGYVEGYTDGLEAAPVSPGVARLVPNRR